MAALEDRPRTLLDPLHAVETFTTVGYGEDAPWPSPLADVPTVAVQLSGVCLPALPPSVVPWLERRPAVEPAPSPGSTTSPGPARDRTDRRSSPSVRPTSRAGGAHPAHTYTRSI